MTDQFDSIRLDIAKRYIELAESGYVDNKELERARLVADALKDTVKPQNNQSVTNKHHYKRQ
jgi:multidrug resistance efflux pump